MNIQAIFLLLSFFTAENFSQLSKSNQAFSNAYHYGSNISIRNFDDTRSTIDRSGNSATLFNSDGTHSTIYFFGRSSTIIGIDGTSSWISHNGRSSTITRSDGTQFFVNHMNSTSSIWTAQGTHTITHTFGKMEERCRKDRMDVLIHMNWLIKKEIAEATAELSTEEQED